MLSLIMLVYLLLALRITVRSDISLCGAESGVSFMAGACGFQLRFDGEIRRENGSLFLHIKPRYSRKNGAIEPMKVHVKKLRAAGKYLLPAAYACRFERIALHMRIGLGDAGMTAMAAGSARALASALLTRLDCACPCDLRVAADFSGAGFALHARCIFSLQIGDIMFAVINAAVKKTGREGFGWKSIPLRA